MNNRYRKNTAGKSRGPSYLRSPGSRTRVVIHRLLYFIPANISVSIKICEPVHIENAKAAVLHSTWQRTFRPLLTILCAYQLR